MTKKDSSSNSNKCNFIAIVVSIAGYAKKYKFA